MAASDGTAPVQGPVRIPVTPAMRADLSRRIRNMLDPESRRIHESMTLTEMIAWGVKSMAESQLESERDAEAWDHPTGRIYWLLSGTRPVVLEWEQHELQAVLVRKARVTPAVMAQISNMAEFDVSEYIYPETSIDPQVDMSLADQLRVLRDVVMAVVKKGSMEGGRVDYVSDLRRAFRRGVKIVLSYASENVPAVHGANDRATTAALINDDLKVWSTKLLDAANSAASNSESPPGMFDLPPALVPTWENLAAGIDTVGVSGEGENAGPERRAKRARTAPTRPSD